MIEYSCCFCGKKIIPDKSMHNQVCLLQRKKLQAVEFVNDGLQFKGSEIIEQSFHICQACTTAINTLARTKGLRKLAIKIIEDEDKEREKQQTNKYGYGVRT